MLVQHIQQQCYGVRRCVAHGLCRSRFYSTRRKVRHHVTWCLTKTSHPTSRWDVAVINGHCSRTVLPLTPPETHKLASVRTFSSLSQTFCPPNSPDLNTVNLPSGVLFTGFIGSLRSPWKSLNFGEKKSRPLTRKCLKSPWIWMFHILKFLHIKMLKKAFL